MEACPWWLVHPAVLVLLRGAADHAGRSQNYPEHGSASCGLVYFTCDEQWREFLHPFAAQGGPCLASCIALERHGVWGETRELGLLASVLGVVWTAGTQTMSQTPGPGASACFFGCCRNWARRKRGDIRTAAVPSEAVGWISPSAAHSDSRFSGCLRPGDILAPDCL